jgi:flagellar biosynthetic protein FliR
VNEALEFVANLAGAQLEIAFLVFLRVSAMFTLLPALGEQSVPVRIRLMLALLFTVLLAPMAAPHIPPLQSTSHLASLVVSEVVAGLALGMLLRLAMMVIQIAGSIAANVTSLAQVFGGSSVDPQPAIAHLLFVAGLAIITLADLHLKVLMALIDSYMLFVPGNLPSGADLADWMTGNVSHAFSFAFTLAAPFVVVSLIYNLALGAINRAMPQLMVAFVGAPAITAAGLILLLLCAPAIVGLWALEFDRIMATLGVR